MKILLALPLLLLTACQATSFEHAPLAASDACDPALVGNWSSVGDTPEENGEVVLRLDAACQLRFEEHKADGVHTGAPVAVYLGRYGEHAYAWVDAAWALEQFDEDHRPPAGDIMLVRYRLDGDTLQMWSMADKPIAHAIIDGDVDGEVIAADNELFNRVTGDPNPSVLERVDAFDADPGTFTRIRGD